MCLVQGAAHVDSPGALALGALDLGTVLGLLRICARLALERPAGSLDGVRTLHQGLLAGASHPCLWDKARTQPVGMKSLGLIVLNGFAGCCLDSDTCGSIPQNR